MFCIVDLHVVLDIPQLDLPDLIATLRPLDTTYTLGCAAFKLREPMCRLGTIRLSLASGSMFITVSAKHEAASWRGEVMVSDAEGSLMAVGDLASLLSGRGFDARVID
jgi:hypothetical protein